MIREPIGKGPRVFLGVLSILLLFAGYEFLSYQRRLENPKDKTMPSMRIIWRKGVVKAFDVDTKIDEVRIKADSYETYKNLFLGMLISAAIAIPIGVLMGCNGYVDAFFAPTFIYISKIPPTASMAVFFCLFGTESLLCVAIVVFGVMPSLACAIRLGVAGVPQENISKAYTLGASTCEVIWDVVYKQIRPKINENIRLQIGPAIVFLLGVEVFCANVGFGHTIRIFQKRIEMDIIYFYLILLGLLGYLVDKGLERYAKWRCPWYYKGRR